MQRWALTLGAYHYSIKFQKGTENSTVGAVSLLPLPETRSEPPKPAEVVYLMEYLDTSQSDEQPDSKVDRAKVNRWIQLGWHTEAPEDNALCPFFHRRCELSWRVVALGVVW